MRSKLAGNGVLEVSVDLLFASVNFSMSGETPDLHELLRKSSILEEVE